MLAAEAHLQARELVDVPELPPNVYPPGDHDCVFFYEHDFAGWSVHLTQQPTSPGDIYYGLFEGNFEGHVMSSMCGKNVKLWLCNKIVDETDWLPACTRDNGYETAGAVWSRAN